MMDKLTGSKKRITAALIAIVLTFAAVAGIAAAVRATTASTVAVIPVSDLNYGNYLDWQNNVTGKITTEAEQNIYLSDTEKVQEVAVQEGQVVRKGDVLLRYDTESTRLSLEKEKVKREKIELDIEVAKENIKTLENASADSDGGDFGLIGDFIETDPAEVLAKASVHEKVLRADAKPVSEGSEYEILGTEFAPYVFLCKGDSVIMTKDFIKKWQKVAEKLQSKQLYIELAVLDEAQKLQKAWIQDIMLLDPNYDIEVDLRTGKTSYAAMNDPEQMAALLRKILLDVPENERGAWLAAMFDKLMVLTEKEEEQTERGALFAAMLNELDPESLRHFFGMLSEEQLKVLLEEREEEIRALLEKAEQEKPQPVDGSGQASGDGAGTSGGSGNGEGAATDEGPENDPEASGTQNSQSVPDEGSDEQEKADPEPAGESEAEPQEELQEPEAEPAEEPSEPEPEQQENSGAGGSEPSTATDTTSKNGGSKLLSSDTSYTSDELAKARREAKDKLRDLELNLRESDIKIEKARKALDKGVITADMNGVVKTAGDPKSPPTDGSAFITVAGSDGLFVRSGIKESKLGTLKEGDVVTVTSWQTGGQYEAEIRSISPYPDSTGMFDESGTETYFPFTANILDREAVLQNGEWVGVSYKTSGSSAESGGTMSVMKAFVREEGSKKYVFVRGENNRLRKQYIVTGTLSDEGYEVLDGLSESDWIAFPYGKNVKEGAKTREASIRELYE
ncbi:MAG: biotin/lipoyl-binding protein [Lachnospiraceae bacterium]|nr:biotin/lipoyl-binding protein [Lachnospiraceae bacterium]